jgi:hypothetical protein
MVRGLCCAALVIMLAGCELLQNFETPTISDTSQRWMSGDSRVLTASVDVPQGYQVVAVYARYARHHWPGAADAHDVPAQAIGGGNWRATPPLAQAALQADHLFYEWFVDYRLTSGTEVATVRTGRRDFVIGCSDNSIAASINTLGVFLRAFDDIENGAGMAGAGFFAVPHGNTSLAQIGLTFVGASSIFSNDAVQMGPPGLLFVAPRAQRSDETDAEYQALVEDPNGDTTPYRVIGGAWGKVMDSATRRPSMGCIPSSEWFLHEAGFHLNSGVMALRVPDETVRGETVIDNVLPNAETSGETPDDVLMWHPRIWDLHVWLPQDGNGSPVVSPYAPFAVPGARACRDTPDPECTAAVFFFPETFE